MKSMDTPAQAGVDVTPTLVTGSARAGGEPSAPRARRAATSVLFALPTIIFLATFGAFFADKNREARTVLRSGRGLLVVACIVAGYAAFSLMARRLSRHRWVSPVALSATILALAFWVVRPYYVDATADRRLIAGPVREVQERGPVPAPTAEPAPTRLSAGPIGGIDHHARGRASIIRDIDSSLVVRFEDFDIEGVPDPRLYLVPGRDARRPGGASLGKLPGNRGAILDIAVPAGVDAGPGWTVLVWCGAFSVPVANATQALSAERPAR